MTDSESADAAATTATLGRYAIVRELGRGAMGRVFLAHDPQIERLVAIKIVQFLESLPQPELLVAQERFLREARAVGRLVHPGIVTLFDVDEVDGQLFLVMEYVEGPTLETYCRPDALLAIEPAVALVAHVAECLGYAHAAGFIHRDVKPANLIRVGPTSIKITDFGLAKPFDANLTHDDAVLGTPSYMAPEQLLGGVLDGRSDLFSLAVVLYELLTGRKPFPGDSISSTLYRIAHEPPLPALRGGVPLPGAYDDFLAQALAKDPSGRFATAASFAEALREAALAAASAGAPAPPALPVAVPARYHPPSQRHLIPYALAAALVLGVGASGVVLLQRREPAAPAPPWETTVRVEPPDAELALDGRVLAPSQGGRVRYGPDAPLGTLSARLACRVTERQLAPADAGAEVVLVLDPITIDAAIDPGARGALRLNGEAAGHAPGTVPLDLCRANRLEVAADGFRPQSIELPAGLTPIEARQAIARFRLEPEPRGSLALPRAAMELVYYVDGRRQPAQAAEIALTEGSHELRVVNEAHWIDARQKIEIRGGERAAPDPQLPPLATLVVQAFPSNCRVYLRRPGGAWVYIDETPAEREIAVGRYEVKVEHVPTGRTRIETLTLSRGTNVPVRIAFGEQPG